MLLNSVIIILREVLEASLIISILLSFSQMLDISRKWSIVSLCVGLAGSVIYAINIRIISDWFEGVGQEVVNASLQLLIYLVLIVFIVASGKLNNSRNWRSILIAAISAVVVLATVREGAEIMLYIYGFVSVPDLLQPVLIGGVIGAGIGISMGVFFYYFLTNSAVSGTLNIGFILLIIVGGGMILQVVQLLTQADFIDAGQALWDSSNLISEHSLTGQLLYALIGYEAKPSATQVIYYTASIIVMFIAFSLSRSDGARKK